MLLMTEAGGAHLADARAADVARTDQARSILVAEDAGEELAAGLQLHITSQSGCIAK